MRHWAVAIVVVAVSLSGTMAAGASSWKLVTRGSSGPLVERTTLNVGGASFTVARFSSQVGFHLHVGTTDPPGAKVPADAGAAVSAGELSLGLVGAFNGGFKAKAGAGGTWIDGVVLTTMIKGMATAGINRNGQLAIGVWGQDMPKPGYIEYRQNLMPMVMNGVVTAAVTSESWYYWGGVVTGELEPRSALGVDNKGRVLYLATMTGVTPLQVARALVAAGAVRGMELDINPAWPVLGLAGTPVRQRSRALVSVLPGGWHSPAQYMTGSSRDFFVAVAPPRVGCRIWSPLLKGPMTPEPMRVVGRGC